LSPAAPPPAKKPPPEEEEKPGKQIKPKKPLHVPEDDEREPGAARAAEKAAAAPLPELALAEDQATNQVVRDLFRSLKIPYDVVTWKSDHHETRVEPISTFVGAEPDSAGRVNLRFYDDKWKPGIMQAAFGRDFERVDHYEEIALRRVDKFRNADAKALPRLQVLQAAETVLAAVVRFHQSAKDSGRRDKAGWDAVEKRLREQLLAVQLDSLTELAAKQKDWPKAFALATRLADAYPDPDVRNRFAKALVPLVEQSLQEGNFSEVRLRLKVLEEQFPDSPATAPLRKNLKDKADALFKQAMGEKDKAKAVDLLNEAEILWPRLGGLGTYRGELLGVSPTLLGVGVRTLPEYLSPAKAVTDSEKQGVELIFESLVKRRITPGGEPRYEPGLAVRGPRSIPVGREFQLPPLGAFWSNGDRVTAMDVSRTVQLMHRPECFSAAWSDLVDEHFVVSDPNRIDISLRQGFISPLSLMTFKVLPAAGLLNKPDDDGFARNPVGSGPFQLTSPSKDRQSKDADAFVEFTANDNYRRAGKTDQPYLRKIRFYRPKDPVGDFLAGRLHLLWDPSAKELQRLGSVDVVSPPVVLPNLRIYFLAVNHRIPALQDQHLRKAIAHGIDRTKILNEVFRGDFKWEPKVPHRPLNGPFPPGSWACKPSLKLELYDPPLAKKLLESQTPVARPHALTLKYPDDDERVGDACNRIREQLQPLGIEIKLEPRSPRDLHKEVEGTHEYELAYYHFDYLSEAFWLWPLFHSRRPAAGSGSRNYLGYDNDGELEREFRLAMDHCEFARVKEYTHNIHELLYERMPIIPLWQLDTVLALHTNLHVVNVDPLLLFTDVQEWKLEKK
jgi:peptide/nickel transport system substrate-binding protein